MKTIKLCFLGLPLFLSSCAPRIMTDMQKTYPVEITAEEVRVFEQGDSIPEFAEALGRISITDAGFTTKCEYDYILSLARKETAEAGGNGFAVTKHSFPSVWGSSCHQIAGLALRIGERDSCLVISDPVWEIIAANTRRRELAGNKIRAPRFTLDISAGGGFITSRVITPYGSDRGTGGMDWRLAFEQVFNSGIGYSIQYVGSKTTFTYNYSMTQLYIAPSLIYRGRLDNWILKVGVGIGYFGLRDEDEKVNKTGSIAGVGFNSDLGVEYMFSEHIGLGISLNAVSASFPNADRTYLEENEYSGMGRISALAGFRYYF